MVKGNLIFIFWPTIDNSDVRFLATSLLHTRQVLLQDKEQRAANLKMQVLAKTMVMQLIPKMPKMPKMETKMQELMRAKLMTEAKLIIVKDFPLRMLLVGC